MYELKFGKYKGKTVEQVAKDEDGIGYLEWLKKSTNPNDPKFGKTNRILLAEIDRVLTIQTEDPKPAAAPGKFVSMLANDPTAILIELLTEVKEIKSILKLKTDETFIS